MVGVDQQSGRFGFTNADPDEWVNTADRVYLRYDESSTPVAMIVAPGKMNPLSRHLPRSPPKSL